VKLVADKPPEAPDGSTRSQRDFLTPRQIADMTSLHVAVVRRAIERGELPAYKLCSRLRVSREDFDAWLEANRVAP
jgi:excisionase family DNA binding protein